MSDWGSKATVLSLDGVHAQPVSIRAKALVFEAPASLELRRYLERVAPSEAPVVILGETGTGKELVARHIHQLSGRKGPFVAVNCGAISEQLAESELFGHEPGAFTGATPRREGWFEAAHRGTLFLDEIGDLPLPLQVKLLRVLQEREVVRVGSRRPIPVDIRLVAATNVDLNEAVKAGRFRLDLVYRLNIAQVRLAPLRERIGDIVPLAEHFLRLYTQKLSLPPQLLSDRVKQELERYHWPGNIRELENVIHFALLVAPNRIQPEHLQLAGSVGATASSSSKPLEPKEQIAQALRTMFEAGGDNLFETIEKLVVDEAFRHSRYNQVRAASLLGISRNVLRTLLKKYHYLSGRSSSSDAASGADEEQDDDGRGWSAASWAASR